MSYKVVYRLFTPAQIEIIEIWGIGKRSKEEIFRIIGKRIDQYPGISFKNIAGINIL